MFKKILPLLLVPVVLCSCASIVSKSTYNVRLDSSPRSATVQVFDRKGLEIFNGTTPTQVALKSGAGYFRKARYSIKYTKPGYLSKEVMIDSDINGWYFGNIVFGGLIGFLIVDPATGAMYKLDRIELNETLASDSGTGNVSEKSLRILEIQQVPEALRKHLELIK